MHTHEALLTRRTAHRWIPGTLPEGALERALTAAHHAPNHTLTWPWRFTIIGPVCRKNLADLYVELKSGSNTLTKEQITSYRAKILNPCELVVVSQIRCDEPFRAKEDYASCACAIQNMALSLWAEGVSSKWSTGKVTRHAETYRLTGVDLYEQEIVGFVWAGYPVRTPIPPRRPNFRDFVRQID